MIEIINNKDSIIIKDFEKNLFIISNISKIEIYEISKIDNKLNISITNSFESLCNHIYSIFYPKDYVTDIFLVSGDSEFLYGFNKFGTVIFNINYKCSHLSCIENLPKYKENLVIVGSFTYRFFLTDLKTKSIIKIYELRDWVRCISSSNIISRFYVGCCELEDSIRLYDLIHDKEIKIKKIIPTTTCCLKEFIFFKIIYIFEGDSEGKLNIYDVNNLYKIRCYLLFSEPLVSINIFEKRNYFSLILASHDERKSCIQIELNFKNILG